MVIDKNPFFNSSGCPDPTAYKALKDVEADNAQLEGKVAFLVKVLKFIINESGFELINRIELRDKETRRIFK